MVQRCWVLSVLGRPTNLKIGGQGSVELSIGAGGACFGHFSLVYLFSFLPPSLGDGPIYTEILCQRAVNPKSTN